MATYSGILAQSVPWTEEPCWVTVPGVTKIKQLTLLSLPLFKNFFIEIYVPYSVVLVSVISEVNQLYYTYPLFLSLFPHMGHCRVLSRAPCVLQQVVINFLCYLQFITKNAQDEVDLKPASYQGSNLVTGIWLALTDSLPVILDRLQLL